MALNLKEQLSSYRKSMFFFVPIFMILVAIYIIYRSKGIDPKPFFIDPYRPYIYIGSVSYLGIVIWAAAATICFFSAVLISGWNDKTKLFMLVSGSITLIIMFDDLYQLHEIYYEEFFGLREKHVMLIYFVMILLYLIFFSKMILSTNYLMFIIAIIFFGLSVSFDFTSKINFSGKLEELIITYDHAINVWEDVFKILGITAWFIYFQNTGRKFITGSEIKKNS